MVVWARWVLTMNSEIMDTKLRLHLEEVRLKSPFPFPSHKDGFPHMDKLCSVPCGRNDNLLVIMFEDGKVSMVLVKK